MQVTFELADVEGSRLQKMAARCGYDNVAQFVSEYVSQLTQLDNDEDLPRMTEEEMAASVEMIEQSMKDIDEGRYYTLEEAKRVSLDRLREKQR